MPLYEYQCPHGHRLEILRMIKDRDRELHCSAGETPRGDGACGELMKVIISAPAVQFRGSGVTRGSSGFGATPPPPQHGEGGTAK